MHRREGGQLGIRHRNLPGEVGVRRRSLPRRRTGTRYDVVVGAGADAEEYDAVPAVADNERGTGHRTRPL